MLTSLLTEFPMGEGTILQHRRQKYT